MVDDAANTTSDSGILKGRSVAVILPPDLVEAIDDEVGQEDRCAFIQGATRAKLKTLPEDVERRRERLLAALDKMAGSLADVYIPEWETPESAATWVCALR
jgi:antitoxin component of MazEF toxin-antitoxin module